MSGETAADTLIKRYQMAFDVVRHVNSTLDADEVIRRAIDILVKELGAERGLVMLRGPSGDLEPRALRRIDANEMDSDHFRTSRTLLARVLKEGEPVLTADAQVDANLSTRASVVGLNLRSVMVVPLKIQGRVEGVLYLDNSARSGLFSEGDLEVVTLVTELIAIALQNARAHDDVRASRDLFSRYVNHQVAEAAGSDEALAVGGARADVAVLNADLRGYSVLSRELDAPQIVATLNEWLREAIDHVIDYGGNIDKFVGDAILAVFGAPVPVEGATRRAIVAAVEMFRSIRSLNERRTKKGLQTLGIGAGVDYGEVVAGNVGSDRRLEYTVIGEPVNDSSWLASQAAPMEILVTEAAWAELDGKIPVRETRKIRFKGAKVTKPVVSVDWEAMVD